MKTSRKLMKYTTKLGSSGVEYSAYRLKHVHIKVMHYIMMLWSNDTLYIWQWSYKISMELKNSYHLVFLLHPLMSLYVLYTDPYHRILSIVFNIINFCISVLPRKKMLYHIPYSGSMWQLHHQVCVTTVYDICTLTKIS